MRQTKPVGTTATSKSRKRKRSSSEGDDEPMAAGIDQRAKAESHVRALESLITGIFEAEDNLQPDTSERAIDKASKYWMSSTLDNDTPCLSAAVQTKLETSIHRVIGVGRFSQIPVDDIARLQKLCESTLKSAEETNIKLNEESSADDAQVDSWLAKVGILDNGLKTSKTLLRIMVGGREEKVVRCLLVQGSSIQTNLDLKIYNEDLLQGILTMLKSLLDDCVNPLIELRPSEKPIIFKGVAAHRKILGGLLHEITNVFALLSLLIASEDVPEKAVTTMEFIAKDIIFIDNASNEKDSVLGTQKVERYRVAAMDILAKVVIKPPEYHYLTLMIFRSLQDIKISEALFLMKFLQVWRSFL